MYHVLYNTYLPLCIIFSECLDGLVYNLFVFFLLKVYSVLTPGVVNFLAKNIASKQCALHSAAKQLVICLSNVFVIVSVRNT